MLQRTFHHPLDQIRRNDRDDFEPVKTKNANTLANLALLPDRGRGTFGSAGAGRGMVLRGATNIRLRWSRSGMELRALQTFGSAGAGASLQRRNYGLAGRIPGRARRPART